MCHVALITAAPAQSPVTAGVHGAISGRAGMAEREGRCRDLTGLELTQHSAPGT